MAVAVAINSIVAHDPGAGIDKTQSALIVEGSLTLSGNYGAVSPANGDPIDFANARITSSSPPRRVEIFQVPTAGNPSLPFSFLYAQGTTQSNGELIVVDSTTGLEITQGDPYGGGLTGTTANIRFRATFPLFV